MRTIFLVILLLSGVALSGFADEKPPRIQADKMVYDFGKVTGLSSVAGKFRFTNVGGGTLKFEKPHPSCGRTVANLNPESIAAGETAELDFTLSLGPGRALVQKNITIVSNDPETPKLQLSLKADYVPLYDVSP